MSYDDDAMDIDHLVKKQERNVRGGCSISISSSQRESCFSVVK